MPKNFVRVNKIGETSVFKLPIIYANEYGKGVYKKIIKKIIDDGIEIITLQEYDKQIVEYCSRCGMIVEDEATYIPMFFCDKIKNEFCDNGPLNVGIISNKNDRAIVEKIALKICKYTKFMTILNLVGRDRIANKVLRENGLVLNIENSIEKIRKKCDIIIDII